MGMSFLCAPGRIQGDPHPGKAWRPHTHLFQFVNDHGKSFEDGIGGASEGDDPLGTIPFGDVDAGAALREEEPSAPRHPSGFPARDRPSLAWFSVDPWGFPPREEPSLHCSAGYGIRSTSHSEESSWLSADPAGFPPHQC